jgi:hypothetical protein
MQELHSTLSPFSLAFDSPLLGFSHEFPQYSHPNSMPIHIAVHSSSKWSYENPQEFPEFPIISLQLKFPVLLLAQIDN